MGTVFFTAAFFVVGGCSVSSPDPPTSIYHGSVDPTGGVQVTVPGDKEPPEKEPGEGGGEGEGRTSVFPYFLNLDTVAYMNCSGDTALNDPVFFTFKFGSYVSGLRLTAEYEETLGNFDAAQREQTLQSADFIDAWAQLSLSRTGSPGQIAQLDSSTPVVQTLTLNQPSVLRSLAVNKVAYKLAHNAPLEMSLPYPGNSLFDLIPKLDTQLTVYLTYSNRKDHFPISTGNRIYHGRYFNFNFNSNKNYLKGVREYNLLDEKPSGNWVCPESLRFAIHRDSKYTRDLYNNDENIRNYFIANNLSLESECVEDSNIFSSEWEPVLMNKVLRGDTFVYGRTHKAIHTSGRVNWVNTGKKCIRPSDYRYSCYHNKSTVRVEFNEAECSVRADNTKVCPSYLSVCVNVPKEN